MQKIKYMLKAVVILGILIAFALPTSAMMTQQKPLTIEQKAKQNLGKLLTMNPGWILQASGFWEESRGINYMDAVDEYTAWGAGYDGTGNNVYETIYTRTTDGGDFWYADMILGSTMEGYGIGNICAIDGDTAWAAVFSTGTQDEICGIYKTVDGGDNWDHVFNGPISFANNVIFFDENDGVALGDLLDDYFEVYTTSDGGENWVRVPQTNFIGDPPGGSDAGWTGVCDKIGDTVLFGAHSGYVWKSDDRGYTWKGSYTGIGSGGLNAGVNEIAFRDSQHGLAVHISSSDIFDLYTTSDGMDTWQKITPTGTVYGNSIAYVPGTNNMYVCTGAAEPLETLSGASYSLDGGFTWVEFPEVKGTQLLACDFVEGRIGWAGAFNEDDITGGVYMYTPPENSPPDPPVITGPAKGSAGATIEYSFVTDDPDIDDIAEYIIDWGDGSGQQTVTGPFESGEMIKQSHSWDEKGEYTIKAKAKDTNNGESLWGSILIEIPRLRAHNMPFMDFLASHPDLFPILQKIIQRLVQ